MDRLAGNKGQEEDLASNFSFAESDNLNLTSPKIEAKPQYSRAQSINSELTPNKTQVISKNEQPIILASEFGPSSGPGAGHSSHTTFSKKEAKGFVPPIVPGKRASMGSQLSEYSAKGNHIAQPVSVKVVNQDLTPSVSKKYYPVDERDDEQDLAESVSTVHEDSIKLGKLSTKPGASQKRLEPDMTFNTNVESSVPPRSSRRPKSEILLTTNDLDKDIEKFNKNKATSHTKRSSIAISDDLDRLMESANSITLQFYVYKSVDDKIEYQERKPLASRESEHELNYEERINRNLTPHSFQQNERGLSANSVISRAPSTSDSYKTADILGTEASVNEYAPKTSLPPRPTHDNIQRARQVSNQISEQQKQAGDSQHGESPLGTPIQNSANHEDEYYDIDEPEVLEKPSRGKSVKDSTQKMKKIKHKKAKAKRVRSQSSLGLKPFSYHTLINLLESTNGTIIGEEFEHLNLPIKEKQLIEKIVDSLSRLTSDMVLDENRYDVGITRLEKAHRALEGFL